MEVILTQDVENLGSNGKLVSVKDGFARNYLIPQGLAIRATTREKKILEHQYRLAADKQRRALREANDLKTRIEHLELNIPVSAGEDGKIFGSVTNAMIAERLGKEGIEIDRRKIEIDEPIHALGMYTVTARVAPEVTAALRVWVVKG